MPDISPSISTTFSDTNQSLSILSVCDAFNARCDSQRLDMPVTSSFAQIPGTPKSGSAILLIEGQYPDQAAGIFILAKVATAAGQVSELMQVAGTGAHAGEKFQLQWVDGRSPEIKTTGPSQSCYLRWRA